jgi:hypothetical protein
MFNPRPNQPSNAIPSIGHCPNLKGIEYLINTIKRSGCGPEEVAASTGNYTGGFLRKGLG